MTEDKGSEREQSPSHPRFDLVREPVVSVSDGVYVPSWTLVPASDDLVYGQEGCNYCHNDLILCLDKELWKNEDNGIITKYIADCTCSCHPR